MPKRDKVSMSVIRRLPRYFRFLSEIEKSGHPRISSHELARQMGITASQIRQDLNCFGGFGQQGYGYDVSKLRVKVASLLGLNERYPAIMIGGGNLGRAVAIYLDENYRGFNIEAIFEKSQHLVGRPVNGINVFDILRLETYCRENNPKAAILCVSTEAARSVVDQLYACGIRSFWNFSHYDIVMKYPDCLVENVHLSDSLMTLCYRISEQETKSAEQIEGETEETL